MKDSKPEFNSYETAEVRKFKLWGNSCEFHLKVKELILEHLKYNFVLDKLSMTETLFSKRIFMVFKLKEDE